MTFSKCLITPAPHTESVDVQVVLSHFLRHFPIPPLSRHLEEQGVGIVQCPRAELVDVTRLAKALLPITGVSVEEVRTYHLVLKTAIDLKQYY